MNDHVRQLYNSHVDGKKTEWLAMSKAQLITRIDVLGIMFELKLSAKQLQRKNKADLIAILENWYREVE